MKVKLLKTGETKDVENGYAVRLIEQGKAVKAEEESAPAKGKEKKGGDK